MEKKRKEIFTGMYQKKGKGQSMLEQAGSMFDDMEAMMHRIKKKVYKERMEDFREKNSSALAEITGYV